MAHAGGFGGIEATARAKTELVESLSEDGIAILNRDDHRVAAMASATSARVVWFGEHADADVRASDIAVSARGTTFTVLLADGRARP